MSTVRFKTGAIDLELSGTEGFVVRQLALLAPMLDGVDARALEGSAAPARPARPRAASPEAGPPAEEAPAPEPVRQPEPVPQPEPDGLRTFLDDHRPRGRDRQTDAALLIAYYLREQEGKQALRMGDLIGSCIRAGVDTRNLNRPIGILTRRGLLEEGEGNTYRISGQGVQAVESRL